MIYLDLTTDEAIDNLTPLKMKEILLSPFIERLKLTTHYSKIPDWKFIRNLELDNSTSITSNLREFTIEGNPLKQQMCIGDLLLGLSHLFYQPLDLRELTISSYNFMEFIIEDIVQLQLRVHELKLKDCKFNNNSTNSSALQMIKHVSIVNLQNTKMPFKMMTLFSDLIWIKFNNCNYLNDDQLIQVFDICPKVQVNIYF